MRRLYTVLTAFFLIGAQVSFAQNVPSFGLRGGITVSSLRGAAMQNLRGLLNMSSGMITAQPRTGFHTGGYMNLPLTDQITIEPGIFYSQKGYRMQSNLQMKALNFPGANAYAELQSTYIDLPLLLKVNVVNGLQLFAGPQVSYLAKSNLRIDAGALGISLFKKNIDVTDNFKKWDAAVTGGLGYEFSNGFNIQASYDYGLSRVDANSSLKSYNNVLKVGVGFRF